MKTITIDYDLYNGELTESYGRGLKNGEQCALMALHNFLLSKERFYEWYLDYYGREMNPKQAPYPWSYILKTLCRLDELEPKEGTTCEL